MFFVCTMRGFALHFSESSRSPHALVCRRKFMAFCFNHCKNVFWIGVLFLVCETLLQVANALRFQEMGLKENRWNLKTCLKDTLGEQKKVWRCPFTSLMVAFAFLAHYTMCSSKENRYEINGQIFQCRKCRISSVRGLLNRDLAVFLFRRTEVCWKWFKKFSQERLQTKSSVFLVLRIGSLGSNWCPPFTTELTNKVVEHSFGSLKFHVLALFYYLTFCRFERFKH